MKQLLRKLIKFLAYSGAAVVIVLAIAVGIFRLMLPRERGRKVGRSPLPLVPTSAHAVQGKTPPAAGDTAPFVGGDIAPIAGGDIAPPAGGDTAAPSVVEPAPPEGAAT